MSEFAERVEATIRADADCRLALASLLLSPALSEDVARVIEGRALLTLRDYLAKDEASSALLASYAAFRDALTARNDLLCSGRGAAA